MPLGKNGSEPTQINIIDDLMKKEPAPDIDFCREKKAHQVLSLTVLLYF